MNTVISIHKCRCALIGAALLSSVAPMLTGCGDDRPDYSQVSHDNGYSADVTSPPIVAKDLDTTPDTKSSSPLDNNKDPLVQASALDMQNPYSAPAPAAADPLLAPAYGASDVKPLDDNSPTVVQSPAQTDAQNPYWLKGHVTTDHSHWLKGSVMNAHLRVQINNVQVADTRGTLDDDISQYCRKGFNSITFVYQSNGPGSSAKMDLIESEHSPPIPPLATFDSAVATSASVDYTHPADAMTQTLSFIAK